VGGGCHLGRQLCLTVVFVANLRYAIGGYSEDDLDGCKPDGEYGDEADVQEK
jgi:hypothetical protein